MKAPGPSLSSLLVSGSAVLAGFFLLAAVIALADRYTRPAPVDAAHWIERKKNLAELRAQNTQQTETYAWLDAKRGWIRLPVNRGMELILNEWQNPAAGRTQLLVRLEKVVPPAVPAATNGVPRTNSPAGTPPGKKP